jgi:hypothetical protein
MSSNSSSSKKTTHKFKVGDFVVYLGDNKRLAFLRGQKVEITKKPVKIDGVFYYAFKKDPKSAPIQVAETMLAKQSNRTAVKPKPKPTTKKPQDCAGTVPKFTKEGSKAIAARVKARKIKEGIAMGKDARKATEKQKERRKQIFKEEYAKQYSR